MASPLGYVMYGGIEVSGNASETTISVAGTAVQVLVFDTNTSSEAMSPDHTNDHIFNRQASGKFLVHAALTVNTVGGSSACRVEVTIRKNDGASILGPPQAVNLAGGGGESTPISLVALVQLAKGDTVELWIENETTTDNLVVENAILTMISTSPS